MPVATILKALAGNYSATGLYSFEFRDRNNLTITEIVLLLPPEQVDVSEPRRSTLTPTLKGGYIADFGNEFKSYVVKGSCHFFYAGTTARPGLQAGRSGSTPEDFIDGYDEFVKLRFMLSRYRDYTLTERDRFRGPLFLKQELAAVELLRQRIALNTGIGRGALADQIEVVWHDYDADDHYFVHINEFSTSQSKADPWTIQWTCTMQGYRTDTNRFSQKFAGAVTKKAPILERIREVKIMFDNSGDATAPDVLPVELTNATALITNQTTQLNPPQRKVFAP